MKALFTSLLILVAFTLRAQTRISGKVADRKGVALPGANIYIKGTYDGTTSDSNGGFSFVTEEKGKQLLVS
jgi:hypothetical protein